MTALPHNDRLLRLDNRITVFPIIFDKRGSSGISWVDDCQGKGSKIGSISWRRNATPQSARQSKIQENGRSLISGREETRRKKEKACV
jgi:hypothetical protein